MEDNSHLRKQSTEISRFDIMTELDMLFGADAASGVVWDGTLSIAPHGIASTPTHSFWTTSVPNGPAMVDWEVIKRAWDEMESRSYVRCGSAERPHMTSPNGTICHYCLAPIKKRHRDGE